MLEFHSREPHSYNAIYWNVLTVSNCDEFSVEELQCTRDNLGDSHRYFRRCVVADLHSSTLLSMNRGDFKSPSFNVNCELILLDPSRIETSAVVVAEAEKGYGWVISLDQEIFTSMLESMSFIDIHPLIPPPEQCIIRSSPDHDGTMNDSKSLIFNVFRGLVGTSTNVRVSDAPEHVCAAEDKGRRLDVRAVKTAVATLSIVLEPVSLYGGVRPSTKSVHLVVHNVAT